MRFRAMVQDTSPSPEMYLFKLNNNKCGGWGITGDATVNADYSYGDLRECTIVWAVSVPGENNWCLDEIGGITQTESSKVSYEPLQPHKFPVPEVPHVGVQLKVSVSSSVQSRNANKQVTVPDIR